MNRKGVKISLEGIDGVGKTTQGLVLAKLLKEQGYGVYLKPCRNNFISTDVDNDILHILKGSRRKIADVPASEVLLHAARSLYINERHVKARLAAGDIVLCDRDIDTAIAYSLPSLKRHYTGVSPGTIIDWILGLYAIEAVLPDLTILFDALPQIALERALSDDVPNERAIFDKNGAAFIREVRTCYHDLEAQFPERIRRIDVNSKSIDEVTEEVESIIDIYLEERQRALWTMGAV